MRTFLLSLLFILTGFLQAQEQWYYKSALSFPDPDSVVQPYLITTDVNGRVYVASSKTTNAAAHNAIYYADSTDTMFKKLIDFDVNGDSDTLQGNIGAIRGIATVGTDLYINANIPFRRVNNTVASLYYYKNADTNQVEKFGFNISGSGYGTYIHGLAATRDTILFTGITFNTSIRFYNFSYGVTTPARGSWVSLSTYPLEPGGAHFNGFDVIRDVATIPNANYALPETPFYTTRNSLSSSQITGGIAIWTGGDQLNPGSYSGTRLFDAANELTFSSALPYGITVDKNGLLWVAGTDSTRRWVKAYSVLVNFAQNVYSLPAQFDPFNPDTSGAPMTAPSDVAVTPDALTAYVADGGSGKVYKFKYEQLVGIKDGAQTPLSFSLDQNYPNPFNPSTMIRYTLPAESKVVITIHNMLGETVATLFDGVQKSGAHVQPFNAEGLASGLYIYTLKSDFGILNGKMILNK